MNYIRKAVELADGFGAQGVEYVLRDRFGVALLTTLQSNPIQPFLDALAAQLVRQVDATHVAGHVNPIATYAVHVKPQSSKIHGYSLSYVAVSDDNDRTLNTIKAIVDSKVLE